MSKIIADLSEHIGKIKPMHAVNNGPAKPRFDQTRGNFEDFAAAGIPFVRNHDASYCADYGGEHTVDICAIFPDFDADVNDPASYDFVLTDEYTKTILEAGAQVLFRLGNKIEHWKKKYGTLPPKDFKKWAEICEHVIRHYNEGWANGFNWGIEYWEIWNEPDLDPDDSTNKRTWGGTKAEFFELYRITALHLKSCFPSLKIGGPAIAYNMEWAEDFLAAMSANSPRVPIDFFSWHIYATEPRELIARAERVRGLLDRYGYSDSESILNEWNYIIDWTDNYIESIQTIISLKGAAFTAACMLDSQQSSIDMLMYYDARLSTCFNGLFDFYTQRPIKGYYPFVMFNKLYRAGTACRISSEDESIHVSAAISEDGKSYIMLSYFTNDKNAAEKTLSLELKGGSELYDILLLDHDSNAEVVGFAAANGQLTIQPNTVVLLEGSK